MMNEQAPWEAEIDLAKLARASFPKLIFPVAGTPHSPRCAMCSKQLWLREGSTIRAPATTWSREEKIGSRQPRTFGNPPALVIRVQPIHTELSG